MKTLAGMDRRRHATEEGDGKEGGGKECVKKTPLLISYLTKCHYPCSQALPSFLTLVFTCRESLHGNEAKLSLFYFKITTSC